MRGFKEAIALMLVLSVPVAGDELWRGPAGTDECRLQLVNELGEVRVAGSAADSVPAVSGAPGLAIEATTSDGVRTLTVARKDGAPSSDAGSGEVELSVPAGCDVAVRTADGAVDVAVGPAAFPLAVDTVTGDVTAWVDPAAAATIVLATSGEITTDYTIEIDFRYHEEPAKYGRIVIGDGATGAPASIQLTSRRGAVSVLRPTEAPSRPR